MLETPAPLTSSRPEASAGPATGSALRRTALFDAHRRLGAKLVGFGGWEMPLAYPQGTIAEHRACRENAVVFDVSHLGTVRVQGTDAVDRLQAALSNDLRRIRPGRTQYTHLLDDLDGSVVDDIIVWWIGDGVFDVMPNASNTARAAAVLDGEETTAIRCVIAVQGPHARRRAASVLGDAVAVPRSAVRAVDWRGVRCVVAGTGYTGEDGFEVAVPSASAERLWDELLACDIVPAGLGARDTLRLEAGFPLHGHELGPGITPLQAGLGWVVGWDKGHFLGRAALLAERERGISRRLVGLATKGRQPPRDGGELRLGGANVGRVTSGNFSPMLGHGIALALVDTVADPTPGRTLEVLQRGRTLPATVVGTPFVTAGRWAVPA